MPASERDPPARFHRKEVQKIMVKNARKAKIIDKIVSLFAIICVILAVIPLTSILIEVLKNGIAAINWDFLTGRPSAVGRAGGGIGPAIQGTLIIVGLATTIGAPIGILTGIYLSEFAGIGLFPNGVRFFNEVMTGLPSVVMGIVGYILIVINLGSFSVWAGAFSLSIIMIPIVSRVTEETFKIVPNSIREAGFALGIPKWKITLFITFKSAVSGILTGVVLAIARIAGETAPLIMTILGTSLFFTSFNSPVDALPLRIWRLSSQPYESAHEQAWGAALVLILMVLILSVALRLLAQRRGLAVKVKV
ncbi:MAG TPA: phosphate ABC transporter permease PstA [Nitrososphaeraceae archaeon]|jgi:phosphate transport system permease protein|nr:phosphate ABC transporter permease PstA [Nitrososphaeraceae archaeon]